MCCWFSISYALWAELLSILEHEHIWHANRGDLHTTKPLLFFQLIWLLLLQYLKFPFHCWEETGFSISRSFFSSSFPCPIIDAALSTSSSAGTQSGGSQKVSLGHGQLHPTPSPWEPTPPCNLQAKAHVPFGREKRLSPPSRSKPWALAQYCERRVCESRIWYAN